VTDRRRPSPRAAIALAKLSRSSSRRWHPTRRQWISWRIAEARRRDAAVWCTRGRSQCCRCRCACGRSKRRTVRPLYSDQPGQRRRPAARGAGVDPRPGRPALLDLGGIAKGFAIDRAVDTLIEDGCDTGLVNAGRRTCAPSVHGHTRSSCGCWSPRGDCNSQRPRSQSVRAKTARSPSGHRGFYSRVTGAELSGHAVRRARA
jgi:hypothetical protein